MKITLNGEATELSADSLTINELLVEKKVRDATYVSVELNGEIVPREKFDEQTIKDGDAVEFLYFTGGGAADLPADQAGLTDDEVERYSRHIILEDVGGAGQAKIKAAKVLVVGAGGLGSPVLMYLAAAGVGQLGVIDADVVDLSNLQRQIIHTTPDIGKKKAESAADTIKALNPSCEVEVINELFSVKNAAELVERYDIIVDGTDNFAAKFLINDACVLGGKPLSHAGILRFRGQLLTIIPNEGPCFHCLFDAPPPPGSVPSCREAGVLGAVAGVIGTLQATEVLKLILGVGQPLVGRLLTWDALDQKFRNVPVKRNPACPVCGENPTITEPTEYATEVCDLKTAKAV